MSAHKAGEPIDPRTGPAERAREAAYREFMEPGELPAGARMDDAEAHLGAMLERELGVPIAAESATTRRTTRTASPRARRTRTMLGLAATIAVVAGASWVALTSRSGREPVLRGSTPPAAGAWDAQPTLQATASRAARLSWHRAPGADSYAVVFLAGDLSELARVGGLADTSFILTPESRPTAIAADVHGLWRVDAYAGDEEIGRSPASPITFP